ncbi:helix-turn-helix transcriptional regulator [Lysinibacillus capsici]|uniref:helix-turn-helix transcriptional regulator n=1 Tax=Lysinibacillus capsici TaxID=2115968 RepID=UPI0032E52610
MIEERVGYMVDSQQGKGYRVLSMFDRLMDGQGINKKQEALTHQVGEKTIQRDIDEIRTYLEKAKLDYHLQYVRTEKVYKLMHKKNNRLSKEQVLVIVKILIASKALVKSDIGEIVNQLLSHVAVDQLDQLLLNEKSLYEDIHQNKSLLSLIWGISTAIQKRKVITIYYLQEGEAIPTAKILKPLAVIFSTHYFYLIGDNQDTPTVYRMDRIQHFREMAINFEAPSVHPLQVEDANDLTRIRILYKGRSPEIVYSRFPTAHLVSQNKHEYVFEAEVLAYGMKEWLLSQGADMEVLEPIELREEIIVTLQAMQQNYRYI